jgi:hypothetical protein
MQYTKQQLDNMDDVQLTLAVSKKLGLVGRIVRIENPELKLKEYVELTDKGSQKRTVFSPCTNWNDAMPIAVKHRMVVDTEWPDVRLMDYSGECTDIIYRSRNNNPRRAICEVFLMMEKE